MVYAAQIRRRDSGKLLISGQHPVYFLAEAIPWFIYIIFHRLANMGSKYVDGFHNSMINNKDIHIPSPLIMVTCTALHHAHLVWQKNKGVHPTASKSKLQADRPDRSNYFNCKNAGGKKLSCCAATSRMVSTSPGIADTYTFWTNTWNTLPESYQQSVYKITLAAVKHQIQQAGNPMPAMVLIVDSAQVDNAILPNYVALQVMLEEPYIGSTDPIILIHDYVQDDELKFRVPGGSRDYKDEDYECETCEALPTASRQRQPPTELERFHLGNRDIDGYDDKDGDSTDADADEEEAALQADNRSMYNVEDSEQSTRECEGWTVYFKHVKNVNCEVNDATACDVSEAKTIAISNNIQMLNINLVAACGYGQ